jgi:hypothetical protein
MKTAVEDGFRAEVDVRKKKANTTNIVGASSSYSVINVHLYGNLIL